VVIEMMAAVSTPLRSIASTAFCGDHPYQVGMMRPPPWAALLCRSFLIRCHFSVVILGWLDARPGPESKPPPPTEALFAVRRFPCDADGTNRPFGR
jgi:hypothetical protein